MLVFFCCLFVFFFLLLCVARGILVLQPGVEPTAPALEAQSRERERERINIGALLATVEIREFRAIRRP